MRICLIASCRFPVAEPFAGGLEAHTFMLARELIRRGHEVALYAGPGSEPSLGARLLDVATFESSRQARRDVGSPPEEWMREHHAYLALMLDLASARSGEFDLVHNNSLHHLPIAMASTLPVPMVTTLHAPPLAWLESALQFAPPTSRFIAVSQGMQRAWGHVVDATPIANGVDDEVWLPGPGGGPAIWVGRIVPEKAPHLAIDAARAAGVDVQIVGPVFDPTYFHQEMEPRLGSDVELLGHLGRNELSGLLGRASVALVTPVWDEPFGLVAVEAMMCGTPVAAVRRGAMSEVVGPSTGRLAEPGDTPGLGRALVEASRLDRADVRRAARQRHGLGQMVDQYERLYEATAEGAA